ncbi:hypothetical protein HAX54_013949, partial [Datura stramonium]|nr:hypothetical protein [Datura stramonium]
SSLSKSVSQGLTSNASNQPIGDREIIVEEIQNLVLDLTFSEERSEGVIHEGKGGDEIGNESIKAKSESEYGDNHYKDEIAVHIYIIIEELQNLILNQALSEERSKGDIHEENGRDEMGNV